MFYNFTNTCCLLAHGLVIKIKVHNIQVQLLLSLYNLLSPLFFFFS